MMALDGIRIVDFSRHAPGPYCTMLLADLGADVIVVEEPEGVGRRVDREMGVGRRAKAFNPVGRNKRSLALDLKQPAQLEVALRLADGADVVVEGFRPGVAKRLGIDSETLRRRNPRLIYCSVSGYGQEGPYASLVGHDLNYISLGGLLGMVGWPGQPPAIPVNAVGDYAGGGLFSAFSILAALIAREKYGIGQVIDMAMSDGVLSLVNLALSETLATGKAPKPGEYYLSGALPCYHVYETSDGKWVSLACMEPWFWKKLCEYFGRPDFAPLQFEAARFPEIFDFLRTKFREKPRDVWFAELRHEEICITPVLSLDEVAQDPHVRARAMIVDAQDPELGAVPQVGIAPKFSATPGKVRTTVPRPGQHTQEVLAELGYSKAEINALGLGGEEEP